MEMERSHSSEGSLRNISIDRISEHPRVMPSELLINSHPEDNSDMIYQVVKLNKIVESIRHEGKNYRALKSVDGLSFIAPDTRFKENSVLSDLIASAKGPLKCEFLIVITMYNEKSDELKNTLNGVISNLKSFAQNGVKPQQIGCIIIVDGVEAFFKTYDSESEFFINYCDKQKILGRFPEANGNVLKCEIPSQAEDDEFAHLFMQKMKVQDGDNELNLQLIFCIKQKNKRKLNTHLWFFGGFCQLIQPKYVMLLDVGTKPLDNSLYYLYEAMENDDKVAGCCGEIVPMDVNGFNLVVPAQMVEYKFAHTFDKALESLFGYVSVLPGAFSAYRWTALKGSPLWEDYFKSFFHPELMTAYQANIFLAEDRVLCLSLVSKIADGEPSYILRYVRKSIAQTDVPSTIEELMVQRRRWINGSWFALIDSITRFKSIYKTRHSWCRKFFFTIQLIYYIINVVFSWLMVGSFFLVFAVTVHSTFSQDRDDLLTIGNAIILVYNALLIIILLISLGVEPGRAKDSIKAITCIFGLYMIGAIILMVAFFINVNFSKPIIVILAFCTVGMFSINVLLNNAILSILKGIVLFLFVTPTYVNIFSIYAICNLHDCTWGNRPQELNNEERERLSDYKAFRTRWLVFWVLTNAFFAYCINFLNKSKDYGANYIYAIAIIGIILLGFRFICGCLYLLQECCKKSTTNSKKNVVNNEGGSVKEVENSRIDLQSFHIERPNEITSFVVHAV